MHPSEVDSPVHDWCNQDLSWRFVSADAWVTVAGDTGLIAKLGRIKERPLWTVVAYGQVRLELSETPARWRFSPATDEWHTVNPPNEVVDRSLAPFHYAHDRDLVLFKRLAEVPLRFSKVQILIEVAMWDGKWLTLLYGDWLEESRYWLFLDGRYVNCFDDLPALWRPPPTGCMG